MRRGSERFAHDLATGLRNRGHQPRLITSHPGAPSRRVEDGIEVIRHWRPPTGRLARRGFEDYLTHAPFSYLSLRSGGDDIAQALFVTDALAAGRWTRRTERPSIYSYMGLPDHRGLTFYRLRSALTVRAVRECSVTTVLSEAAAAEMRRNLGVDPRVIPPGVDLDAFEPAGERSPAPTIFCSADLTEPRKRVGLLVEACALVRRRRPDVRLAVSRPRDAAAAARFTREAPDVDLVQVDDRADLARAYAQAWVTVLPSFGEAFGLVLVESMAAGTPVVAGADGAGAEVVDNERVGRLFRGDRPEDLALAILDALELAQEPGTAEACRRRAEDFSVDRCVVRYGELYRELLGAGSGAASPRVLATSEAARRPSRTA